ncbi:Tad domain-containing protein [Variovorax paradoxus]|nr:Tad domain-containing protein [Variovorax paradoxus]
MKRQENGSILVLMAGLILVLAGFAVLAIDVGRIYIVRNEMQNVADAAALAGANCLTKQTLAGSTSECTSSPATALNWDIAVAKATSQLGLNSAANLPISTLDSGHQINAGYWNLLSGNASGGTLSTTFTPITANDKPAVRVVITKDIGQNNGPIVMLTRMIFGGGADVPMTARAVSVVSSPSTVSPGSLIPQAINKCMFDLYWDSTTGSPKIATATTLNGVPQVIGEPWRIRIGSSYHYGTCESGQWTSFKLDVNSASAIKELINNGNPDPINIGDQTWIEPGTKASNYNDLDSKYPTPPGADVTVAVVDQASGWSTNSQTPVVAFAGFHIDDVRGGSDKYIEGHFIKSTVASGSSGIGPYYGTYTPPRLAQ